VAPQSGTIEKTMEKREPALRFRGRFGWKRVHPMDSYGTQIIGDCNKRERGKDTVRDECRMQNDEAHNDYVIAASFIPFDILRNSGSTRSCFLDLPACGPNSTDSLVKGEKIS